jgi:hypothetical protein
MKVRCLLLPGVQDRRNIVHFTYAGGYAGCFMGLQLMQDAWSACTLAAGNSRDRAKTNSDIQHVRPAGR